MASPGNEMQVALLNLANVLQRISVEFQRSGLQRPICAPQIWLRVLQLGHEKGVLMTRAPQLNLLVWVHICWDTKEDALMVDRTKVSGF